MAKRPEDRFLSAGDFGRAVTAGRRGSRPQAAIALWRRGTQRSAEPTRRPSSRGALPCRSAPERRDRDRCATRRRSRSNGGPVRAGTPGADRSGTCPAPPRGSAPTAQLEPPAPALDARVAGAVALVAVIGVGVAIALAASGGTPTTHDDDHDANARPRRRSTTSSPTTRAADGEADLQPGQRERRPRRDEPADRERDLLHELERDHSQRTPTAACRQQHLRPMLLRQPDTGSVPDDGPWANSGLLLNVRSLPSTPGNPVIAGDAAASRGRSSSRTAPGAWRSAARRT